MTDELRWLEDLKAGRHVACVELIARYQRPLYAFVRQLGHTDADAQDVLQDTFSTVWRTVGSVREPAALRAWIYRVCRNAAHAHADRAQHETRYRGDGDPRTRVQAIVAAVSSENEEQNAFVRRLVTLLGPAQREVVVLHYFGGMNLSECSQVLDAPIGTIKSRLARGLAELKDLLFQAENSERSKRHVQDAQLRQGETRRSCPSP